MSSINHYKQEIKKAEELIRQKKMLPPEVAALLTQYYAETNKYYEKIAPEIQEYKEHIRACDNAISEIRSGRNGLPDEVVNEYSIWLDAYLAGLNFHKLKPYIRSLLDEGRWALITTPAGSAGTVTQTGHDFLLTKAKHWVARIDTINYFGGNRYCQLYGKLGKKEKKLINKFIQETAGNKRTFENSHYLADIYPSYFTEAEKEKSKAYW